MKFKREHLTSKTFFIVLIMILLLPISKEWKLLIFGNKVDTKVINHRTFSAKNRNSFPYDCSILEYTKNYETLNFIGPSGIVYPEGKEITVFYSKKNPEDYLVFNLAGLYLDKSRFLPYVLLLIWIAFYFSFKPAKKRRPR